MRLDDGASLCHAEAMRLTQRDADILHSLDHFGQLDSGHIWDLHFHGLKSKKSWDQVSSRLTRDRFIVKLGRRMVMGDGAGSGKAVYQLGAEGARFLGRRGAFRLRFSAVSEHRLKVADAFTELRALEHAGMIKLLGYLCEPDSHMRLAGVTVRPDLFVDFQDIGRGVQIRLWLEIDRDKENRPQIEAKIRDYVHVFDDWQTVREVLDPIPRVVFLADSEIGRHNLLGYLKGKTGDWPDLFVVDDLAGWAARLC